MKGKRFFMIGVISLSLILLLFFSASAAVKTLRIGATASFADRNGIQMKRILELLSGKLNEAGGLALKGERYDVQMIIYDDKYQADAGRAAFEKLVYQDKVKLIFSYGGAPTLAGIEVTEPNKVLLFTSTQAQQIFQPKYKYTVHTRASTLGVVSNAVFWKKYLKSTALKTVVIMTNDDYTGHSSAKDYTTMWTHCGMKVVDSLYYKRGAVDLNPVAAKLKSINPDIVEFASLTQGLETLRVHKAVYQSGWKGLISSEQAQGTIPDIVNVCGKEAVEGTIVVISDTTTIPNPPPLVIPFRKSYMEKHGVWETDALRMVDGWFYFVEAVKRADSVDPDAIIDKIQGLSVETFFGTSRLCRRPDLGNNRYVDCATPKFYGQVKNGEVVYLDQISAIGQIKMAEEMLGGGKWE